MNSPLSPKMQEMLARIKQQQQQSPVNPEQTIKEDIEDALKNDHRGRNHSTDSERAGTNDSALPIVSVRSNEIGGINRPLTALEKLRLKLKGIQQSQQSEISKAINQSEPPAATTDRHGSAIVYNLRQQRAVSLGGSGKSVVIIGAAGTGKTTCQKGLVQELIRNDIVGLLEADDHKHLISGSPGIVICAYTRRAVANIRRNMPPDLQNNCITIHKLLEYQPQIIEYEEYDEETGDYKTKKKMVFSPNRNSGNPLPSTIHTIIYEESSMLGTDLYEEVQDALDHEVQEIFLGDIQQLPPVFGPAILGFKLLSLPVVELVEVYRQALESPILRLAHRILSGKGIPKSEFSEWNTDESKLHIKPWNKTVESGFALSVICTFFTKGIDTGLYDPEEDIILCPFNKSFGTDEINKKVANHLARKRGAMTYEILAGYNKHYFSPGDKVLFDKEDATILSIESNPGYSGKRTQAASVDLDYWGCIVSGAAAVLEENTDDDMEAIMKSMQAMSPGSGEDENETRKKKSSHIVKLLMNDSEQVIEIETVGEINLLGLGYALTIHKSQGSEWRKVFFITHQSHATMLQRELWYTGVTRAKESLVIVCEADALEKGIRSQRVKGETIEEKAEFFKGKARERIEKSS